MEKKLPLQARVLESTCQKLPFLVEQSPLFEEILANLPSLGKPASTGQEQGKPEGAASKGYSLAGRLGKLLRAFRAFGSHMGKPEGALSECWRTGTSALPGGN